MKKSETDVSSFVDGERCVVISYYPLMSKMAQDNFSMILYYTCDHVREHATIGIPITTSTYGGSISVMVGNVINQFGLGSKLVGVTRSGGTNLVRCKAILEITFDNTGVFDLGEPMFVMDFLAHVLANSRKSGLMDVQSDDGRVDNEVTRINIQRCIA